MNRTDRVDPSACPHCGNVHDARSNFQGVTGEPAPGDVNICLDCGGVAVYADDMTRIVCEDEAILNHPEVIRHRAAMILAKS